MQNLLTIIDVNINRSVEGLRVCEDLIRFIYRVTHIVTSLKEIRHEIVTISSFFEKAKLLNSRDVELDLNKFIDSENEKKRDNPQEIFFANIHRAIEAVRSLEEVSKVFDSKIAIKFQTIRFKLYSIEKNGYSFMAKKDFLKYFNKSIYAILDSGFVKNNQYISTAKEFIRAGVSIIQLRMKNSKTSEILQVAKEVSKLCKSEGVLFIVNDFPEIAILSNADGVHIGQDDIPILELRKILPADMIIGLSTHSLEQAKDCIKFNPDYIAIGPIFGTSSKDGTKMNAVDKSFDKLSFKYK